MGGRDSAVYLAEIYGVALDCGFRTLALEIRDAEPDQMMRKHLNMQLLNHALATGQLEDAERLVGSTPDPDEGRAKVAESFAMRGESRPARTLDKNGNLGCAMSQGLIHRLPSWFTLKPAGRKQAWRDQERLST